MARNQELPGVEGEGVSPVQFKDMDEAFNDLIGARSKRMQWATKEKEAQTALLAIFHKRNLTKYQFDDKVYILKDIEKVVLAPKDEDSGE